MKTKNILLALSTLIIVTILFSSCSSDPPFHFKDKGQYQFGTTMNYKYVDASRDDRKINLYIWYPALVSEDTEPSRYNFDAEPDLSGAPYPVILSSAKSGGYFGPHLASHGFVVVGVDSQDSQDRWGSWLLDYPLDQIFALDQIAEDSLDDLAGMLDFSLVGAMGYSFDGYNALALSGARVDPEYYQSQCEAATPGDPHPESWWIEYICDIDGGWEAFVKHAGPEITASKDGLWQPLTDPRIQAVMPMAPEGAWLFGDRGLASVDRPTLIIAATSDNINYYDLETVFIYKHLGTQDKCLISFVGQSHMMIFDDDQVAKMKHLAVAFFGYYLKGEEEYRTFFSDEYISGQEEVVWGVYTGE